MTWNSHSRSELEEKAQKPKIVYCQCPHCGMLRKKVDKHWTIIRRGKERSGLPRFLCISCNRWFNEKTGQAMQWYGR